MTGALIIFSRVSSGGISTVVSSYEFSSIDEEVEEGTTKATIPFGSSSSLREDFWV
jgi:hypothetical protein